MRWDSAAIVLKTSELLPEPDTPVKTVSRRLGSSTSTSFRLFSRAPCTRIRSWRSAAWVMPPNLAGPRGRLLVQSRSSATEPFHLISCAASFRPSAESCGDRLLVALRVGPAPWPYAVGLRLYHHANTGILTVVITAT